MEILSLVILGVLIVISPGADFVLVLKNSINHGRRAGIWTAIGVSLAICVHIGYSLLGIGYLISQNELLFSIVRYSGSAYLIYLGLKGIFSSDTPHETAGKKSGEMSISQCLAQGFLCNALNPKTMLFFLSIFSQVISIDSNGHHTALIYGLYMVVLHALWFCIVAILFTSNRLQTYMQRVKRRINQACGVGLFAFGTLLAIK